MIWLLLECDIDITDILVESRIRILELCLSHPTDCLAGRFLRVTLTLWHWQLISNQETVAVAELSIPLLTSLLIISDEVLSSLTAWGCRGSSSTTDAGQWAAMTASSLPSSSPPPTWSGSSSSPPSSSSPSPSPPRHLTAWRWVAPASAEFLFIVLTRSSLGVFYCCTLHYIPFPFCWKFPSSSSLWKAPSLTTNRGRRFTPCSM